MYRVYRGAEVEVQATEEEMRRICEEEERFLMPTEAVFTAAGLATAIEVVPGNPAEVIPSYAERGAFDLIVILVVGHMLAGYGLHVNMVKWDFSELLGVYVFAFAVVSVFSGRFVFGESVPLSTWLGLAVIVAAELVIQLGHPHGCESPARTSGCVTLA